MKGSHKTQTCMPLKPVTIRDCEGVVQFTAATTGTFTTQKMAVDRFLSVWQDAVTIRKKAKRQSR